MFWIDTSYCLFFENRLKNSVIIPANIKATRVFSNKDQLKELSFEKKTLAIKKQKIMPK